jgi:hypothetical protein|uniref:Uncharacterized protein n=1 Tax=viral metagenome TaxID=1070528 RepID=A0A6C0E077_9ZZZZ
MSIKNMSKEELTKIIVEQNTMISNMSNQLKEIIDLSNSNLSEKTNVEQNLGTQNNRKMYLVKLQFLLFVLLIITIVWLIFNVKKITI